MLKVLDSVEWLREQKQQSVRIIAHLNNFFETTLFSIIRFRSQGKLSFAEVFRMSLSRVADSPGFLGGVVKNAFPNSIRLRRKLLKDDQFIIYCWVEKISVEDILCFGSSWGRGFAFFICLIPQSKKMAYRFAAYGAWSALSPLKRREEASKPCLSQSDSQRWGRWHKQCLIGLICEGWENDRITDSHYLMNRLTVSSELLHPWKG